MGGLGQTSMKRQRYATNRGHWAYNTPEAKEFDVRRKRGNRCKPGQGLPGLGPCTCNSGRAQSKHVPYQRCIKKQGVRAELNLVYPNRQQGRELSSAPNRKRWRAGWKHAPHNSKKPEYARSCTSSPAFEGCSGSTVNPKLRFVFRETRPIGCTSECATPPNRCCSPHQHQKQTFAVEPGKEKNGLILYAKKQ